MLSVAVLVINSKILNGAEIDKNRDIVERLIKEQSMNLASYEVIADDRVEIKNHLLELCNTSKPHVILTVGGTGVRPTDWAPEATREVIEKEVPGIGEAMRLESLKKVRTAMLSRGTAGIRGRTLIVNLPGSPRGARENLHVLLPILDHTIEKISGEKPLSE